MRNITLLFTLFTIVVVNAQNFPGRRPELLKGREVKVMPLPEDLVHKGYQNFHSEPHILEIYAKNSRSNSTADSLVGRTFTVENVERVPDENYVSAWLTLKDAKGEQLYYNYDSAFSKPGYYDFEVVGGLTLPADIYCDEIRKKAAQIGGDEYTATAFDGIWFQKNNLDGASVYQMFIRKRSSTETRMVYAKVTVKLENNKVITKDAADVNVENKMGNYVCTARFFLNEQDIELLKKNKIISTSINEMEDKLTEKDKIKAIFDCLLTK